MNPRSKIKVLSVRWLCVAVLSFLANSAYLSNFPWLFEYQCPSGARGGLEDTGYKAWTPSRARRRDARWLWSKQVLMRCYIQYTYIYLYYEI
jgi:hypothetical protein